MRNVSYRWFPWVPWLFVLLLLIVMGSEMGDFTSFVQQNTTLVVPGKILRVSEISTGPGIECFVTYQFFAYREQVKGEMTVPSCPYYYQAGDIAPIAYSHIDPTNVRIIPPGGVFWGPVRESLPWLILLIVFSTFWTWITNDAVKAS